MFDSLAFLLDLVWTYQLFLDNGDGSCFFTQAKLQDIKTSSAVPGSLQHTLEERISMYKVALQNSKTAGEASKVRRYDRGLKVRRP